MSEILDENRGYAEAIRDILMLRGEPVAIKLVRKGEEYPEGYEEPEKQISHCMAVYRAREGESFKLPLESQGCMIGASALGMTDTPKNVMTGEFHSNIGMHDSAQAAAKMISDRLVVQDEVIGEVVCPLKDADFVPDVVVIEDIPERIYWIVPATTAKEGGRVNFSTSPFQCACEDVTAVPIVSGQPNISLGCFGCRKRTDMKADEMALGIPYAMIPGFVDHLRRYAVTVMPKAKRD